MSVWDTYPANYRTAELKPMLAAMRAGESSLVVGLSGAGKSNLLGYLAQRPEDPALPQRLLVDANRLTEHSPAAFLALIRRALEPAAPAADADPLEALDAAITRRLSAAEGSPPGVCFLLDLSLLLDREGRLFGEADRGFYNNLRALRDAHKYQVCYAAAARHPLPDDTELSELFAGHVVWLGPLAESDARWSVERYAARAGLAWDAATVAKLLAVSGRYPALLRAACEAAAGGAALDADALGAHPAVAARLAEFWADAPSDHELESAGLTGIALLMGARGPRIDTAALTAKEHLLLQHLQAHAGQVCAKDDLIGAAWPEDQVFERGVRDDSLAQLVRRLREKIEPDPAQPRHVLTVPGRGYRYSG